MTAVCGLGIDSGMIDDECVVGGQYLASRLSGVAEGTSVYSLSALGFYIVPERTALYSLGALHFRASCLA